MPYVASDPSHKSISMFLTTYFWWYLIYYSTNVVDPQTGLTSPASVSSVEPSKPAGFDVWSYVTPPAQGDPLSASALMALYDKVKAMTMYYARRGSPSSFAAARTIGGISDHRYSSLHVGLSRGAPFVRSTSDDEDYQPPPSVTVTAWPDPVTSATWSSGGGNGAVDYGSTSGTRDPSCLFDLSLSLRKDYRISVEGEAPMYEYKYADTSADVYSSSHRSRVVMSSAPQGCIDYERLPFPPDIVITRLAGWPGPAPTSVTALVKIKVDYSYERSYESLWHRGATYSASSGLNMIADPYAPASPGSGSFRSTLHVPVSCTVSGSGSSLRVTVGMSDVKAALAGWLDANTGGVPGFSSFSDLFGYGTAPSASMFGWGSSIAAPPSAGVWRVGFDYPAGVPDAVFDHRTATYDFSWSETSGSGSSGASAPVGFELDDSEAPDGVLEASSYDDGRNAYSAGYVRTYAYLSVRVTYSAVDLYIESPVVPSS